MYLTSITTEGYRSLTQAPVTFTAPLTLLVGENNSGKSAVIDAIRLATNPVSQRKVYFFDAERDQTYGDPVGQPIKISLAYRDLSDAEEGLYMASIYDDPAQLVRNVEYGTDPALPRYGRLRHSVGLQEFDDPEAELRGRIAHVYLPPLRDAVRELNSAGGNRLADVIQFLAATKEEISDFEAVADQALAQLAGDALVQQAKDQIAGPLTDLTAPIRAQEISVAHTGQRMRNIVRSLRVHLSDVGCEPADLAGSGLGYANLVYIATVMLELEKAKEYDLLLLLLEEPEAHLHPQLQAVLLAYLKKRAIESGAGPGRIQVIASTHSPNIASAVSTQFINVMRALPITISDDPPLLASRAGSISLGAAMLDPVERSKIDQYLSVTRASMLFARRVLLVEGIAEALLLDAMAEHVAFKGDANKLRRFSGVTLLSVDSVDFVPYVKLLLGNGGALVDRLAIITDFDGGDGDRRKVAAMGAAAQALKAHCNVGVGKSTLEADLFAPIVNGPVMKEAFLAQHPLSAAKWDDFFPATLGLEERRAKFGEVLRAPKGAGSLDLRKGQYASDLAALLPGAAEAFECPGYIEDVLTWIVG